MARGGLSLKEQGYTPHIPSPLNPSSTETPPRRQRRNDYCRAAKHEQSPTQRLMRQKAAAAWKLMSLDTSIMNYAQTARDEVRADLREHMEDSYPTCSDKEHYTEAMGVNQLREVDLDVRRSDMEKQALVEGDYQEDRLLEAPYLSHVTTRRLIMMLGIMIILGVLTIIRAVSRIRAWQP